MPVEMEDIGILCNYISEILNKLDAKKPDRSDLFGGRKRLDLTNKQKNKGYPLNPVKVQRIPLYLSIASYSVPLQS